MRKGLGLRCGVAVLRGLPRLKAVAAVAVVLDSVVVGADAVGFVVAAAVGDFAVVVVQLQ